MKLLLPVVFLLLAFTASTDAEARNRRNLWQRKRSAAINFVDYRSKLSSPTASKLYADLAGNHNWGLKNLVTWQGPSVYDPMYKYEECNVLGNLVEDCVRFNWNLNFASPLYLSWQFVRVLNLQKLVFDSRTHLQGTGATNEEIAEFVALLPHFVQVEQLNQLAAVAHWDELVSNWGYLAGEVRGLGQPDDHDYALEYEGDAGRFAEVARHNEESVGRHLAVYKRGKTAFLRFVKSKKESQDPEAKDLRAWLLHPKFRHVAAYLLDLLK